MKNRRATKSKAFPIAAARWKWLGSIREWMEAPCRNGYEQGVSRAKCEETTSEVSPNQARLLQPAHNLFGNRLHRRFGFRIKAHRRFFFRGHLARNTRTPLGIVAQLTFLQAVTRIRNAKALFDLEQ